MRARKFIVAGVTATTLIGGGAAALAAGGPHGNGGPHGDDNGRGHNAPQAGPGFQHAESVSGSVAKGFTTTDTQHGVVTAYSSGASVTVLSADAFSKTYVITSATKTDFGRKSSKTTIVVGDTIDISATLAAGTDTAKRISDHGTPVAKATASPSVSPSS